MTKRFDDRLVAITRYKWRIIISKRLVLVVLNDTPGENIENISSFRSNYVSN